MGARDNGSPKISEAASQQDGHEPQNPEKILREENKESLQYLMFLKQNQCGKIEGMRFAYGRKIYIISQGMK